jgi:hypothetical protein
MQGEEKLISASDRPCVTDAISCLKIMDTKWRFVEFYSLLKSVNTKRKASSAETDCKTFVSVPDSFNIYVPSVSTNGVECMMSPNSHRDEHRTYNAVGLASVKRIQVIAKSADTMLTHKFHGFPLDQFRMYVKDGCPVIANKTSGHFTSFCNVTCI